jgi:hypothetical protein
MFAERRICGFLSWKSVYRSLLPLLCLWILGLKDDTGVNAFVTRPPASVGSSRPAPPRWALYDLPEADSYFSNMERKNGDASSFLNSTDGDPTTLYKDDLNGGQQQHQQYHHPYQNATIKSNGVDYMKNKVSINGLDLNKNGIKSTEKANGKKPEHLAVTAPEKANGKKPEHLAVTAPEVNHWTEIMSQGWMDVSSSTSITNWDSVLSDYDLEQIEQYWRRLMPTVSYLGTEKAAKVYQSLCVAYRAHRGQARKSGEPFIIHPVEVSLLLAGLKMDGETVMAGLLHDTVEDTDLTFAQVESLFGHTVRSIVEGETKVSKLPKLAFTEYADEQAENLRQMFVAMTDDYRIIIVKLADRLHNMRTLRHMKPEKQIKISRETLDIFAPLAHVSDMSLIAIVD